MKSKLKNIYLLVLLVFTACNFVGDMKDMFENSQEIGTKLEKAIGSKCFVGWNSTNGNLSYQIYIENPNDTLTIGELSNVCRKILTENTKKKISGISITFGDPPPSDD